jgi:hypothetical protein
MTPDACPQRWFKLVDASGTFLGMLGVPASMGQSIDRFLHVNVERPLDIPIQRERRHTPSSSAELPSFVISRGQLPGSVTLAFIDPERASYLDGFAFLPSIEYVRAEYLRLAQIEAETQVRCGPEA